jgi:ABC-2 type transport system permease protein
MPLDALGELLPAAALFAITCRHVAVAWTPANLLFLAVVVVCGALIEWVVYLLLATLDFWLPDIGKEWIADTFLYPTARYPLHIYGKVFTAVLTFIFPYGFIAYYPAYHFFQQPPATAPAFFPYLSPLVAGILLVLGLACWRFGLRHYHSTGT